MSTRKKRGRPLKGSAPRSRLSLTISAELDRQLRRKAQEGKVTISDLIEGELQSLGSQQAKTKTLSGLVELRKELEALAKDYGVKKLSLFGSALRGELNVDSDIDLLVEFKRDNVPGLFDFAKLQSDLSRVFEGRQIDLRTANDLSRHFRDDIVREALPLYEC